MLYWHWLIVGVALILAELAVPSFTIFWFGLGALIVAAVLWLAPGTALSLQLLIWAAASCLLTFLWFKLLKPRMTDRTNAGIAREAALGEKGIVLTAPGKEKRGRVRFTTPLMGSDEWPIICHEPIRPGDRVAVKDISGNTLIVTKDG